MTPPQTPDPTPRPEPAERSRAARPRHDASRDPASASVSGSRSDEPGATSVTLADVVRELERLERRALSAMFLGAAAIAVQGARFHGVWCDFPEPRPGRRGWRSRARDLLTELPGFPQLDSLRSRCARLVESERERWPTALELTRWAREARDDEWTRLCIPYAQLCEGDARGAARAFSELLLGPKRRRHRWRALAGLALAHAAAGRHRLALGAIESAGDETDCSVGVLVEGLHLALLVAEPHAVRRAAARIDLLVDGASPALAAATARVRRRHALGLHALDERARRRTEDLASDSPAGRVACATVGL